MHRTFPLSLILWFLPVILPAGDIPWRTGPRFRSELQEPFTANWRSVELRTVLEQISLDREVAILLDRRVDPTAMWPVDFVNQSLSDGLTSLAEQFHGGCSLPHNVIYLGPRDASRKLRTLVARRTAELANFEPPAAIPKERQQRWLKTKTVRWDDLDSPREILDRLQTEWQFQITNPELIEHDLWAGAELPEVTGVAALSLILIQFDLTFRWEAGAAQVELVPMPETVVIEKQHKSRGKSAEQTLKEWQTAYPDAEFRLAGRDILVVAAEEVHEELSAGGPKKTPREIKPVVVPLARRQFTLKIKDVSARDLMTELEKTGIVFEYDLQALADAGVDLNQFIALDVRKLSAEDFFHALFDPLGVKFSMAGTTIQLTPK